MKDLERIKEIIRLAFPAVSQDLRRVEPIYETLPGWKSSTVGVTDLKELPPAAREYVSFLSTHIGVQIGLVSTGPERLQTIIVRESDTFQAIIEEGGVLALKRTLLRQGRVRFGKVDRATRQAIKGITDLKRLERLARRLLDVSSWEELLRTREQPLCASSTRARSGACTWRCSSWEAGASGSLTRLSVRPSKPSRT